MVRTTLASLVAMTLSAVILMSSPAFAASKGGSQPEVQTCYTTWQFASATKQASDVFTDQVDGIRYWNQTQNAITVTSTFSGSVTYSASASATLGGGWGPINATVGYNADTSVTWTASEAETITINPGYVGWNEYGNARDQWYGDYYYVTSSCTITDSQWITVNSPRFSEVVAKTQYQGF